MVIKEPSFQKNKFNLVIKEPTKFNPQESLVTEKNHSCDKGVLCYIVKEKTNGPTSNRRQ